MIKLIQDSGALIALPPMAIVITQDLSHQSEVSVCKINWTLQVAEKVTEKQIDLKVVGTEEDLMAQIWAHATAFRANCVSQ